MNNKKVNFQSSKVMGRYISIVVCFTLIALAVIFKSSYLMFWEKDNWVREQNKKRADSVEIKPARGNILSADGQLLVSTLPEYVLMLDFVCVDKLNKKIGEKTQAYRDSMWHCKIDSVCDGLHRIFPDCSREKFRERIKNGFDKRRRACVLYPRRISYIQLKEVKKIPLFKEGRNKSGLYYTEFTHRKKIFGSLATRTLGGFYKGKDSARYGLELSFDSILRGKPGLGRKQKVLNKANLQIVVEPPINGLDIVTTIDVKMQDMVEAAIVDKLKEIDAKLGMVVLMEVATGDVKAITSMTRLGDGSYAEIDNDAVSSMREPGSVFKTASFLTAFNDGLLHMNDGVDVGNGVREMHGEKMKDHNWRKGRGYGYIKVPEILEYSSNIGVSYFIDKFYQSNPQKFIDGIKKTGIVEDLKIPIRTYRRPSIKSPQDKSQYWSKSDLPWMSIGYASQIPPINTVNFYNAVANGGKMMRPRFVSAAMRDGEVVKEFPPEVIKESIATPNALKNIQTCLRLVVSEGLGKKAGSKHFSVSGKTGTAQVWTKAGFTQEFLVSFVGYFPSEAPKYSCIVCILKSGFASGGGHCGPVFARIAESVMANTLTTNYTEARDSSGFMLPFVKNGNMFAAQNVMEHLGINCTKNWRGESIGKRKDWGFVKTENTGICFERTGHSDNVMPDLTGMGLRDAVFLLESSGLKVKASGMGKVVKQDYAPGSKMRKGQTVRLLLETNISGVDQHQETQIVETDTLKKDTLKKDTSDVKKKEKEKTESSTSTTKESKTEKKSASSTKKEDKDKAPNKNKKN